MAAKTKQTTDKAQLPPISMKANRSFDDFVDGFVPSWMFELTLDSSCFPVVCGIVADVEDILGLVVGMKLFTLPLVLGVLDWIFKIAFIRRASSDT